MNNGNGNGQNNGNPNPNQGPSTQPVTPSLNPGTIGSTSVIFRKFDGAKKRPPNRAENNVRRQRAIQQRAKVLRIT